MSLSTFFEQDLIKNVRVINNQVLFTWLTKVIVKRDIWSVIFGI